MHVFSLPSYIIIRKYYLIMLPLVANPVETIEGKYFVESLGEKCAGSNGGSLNVQTPEL